jgi:hypothetical protein
MLDKLRVIFTPALGSRIRNGVRVILPAFVLAGWVDLTPDQIAAIVIAVEFVFTSAGQVTKHY